MGARTGSGKREPKNLYQREGVYYARITVGGKPYRESLETRDRREAERRLKAWLADKSPYHGTIRHTFQEAAVLWLQAGRWKPKTAQGYAKLLNGVVLPHFGELFWDQVDKPELQRFVKARQEAGVKMATVNRALTVISGIADHVRELDGWPELNPVRLLPVKSRKPEKWNYVRPPASDIEAVFARMKGTFGDMCRVLLLSGLRKDEITMLHRDHAMGGRATIYDTKSGIPRTIPWTDEARALVEKQPALPRSPYLFNTRHGGRYRRATEMWIEYSATAQKMAQRTGRRLTLMRLHDLRHEYAIRYLESGGSLYTLQKLLGHGSIKQTERYLAYITPEQAAKAMAAMAQ
jgi:integrase/recombinase XerD